MFFPSSKQSTLYYKNLVRMSLLCKELHPCSVQQKIRTDDITWYYYYIHFLPFWACAPHESSLSSQAGMSSFVPEDNSMSSLNVEDFAYIANTNNEVTTGRTTSEMRVFNLEREEKILSNNFYLLQFETNHSKMKYHSQFLESHTKNSNIIIHTYIYIFSLSLYIYISIISIYMGIYLYLYISII